MANNSQEDGYRLNRTGLIYDPLMLDYDCLFDENYPEKPDRIKCPYERCQFYGLTEKCINLPGRFSTDDEVEKCHTARVNKLMKDCEKMTKEELYNISIIYDSMYFHQNSNKAARFALGSSIELLDNIMSDKVDNGFAIIRPPGHHAMHDEPNGYCYFNNAAVVARLAIEKYKLERVLIVDWDVHHGQGTQYQFYDDPKVLYFSMHRYDYGRFWPNLRQSDFDYIGEGAGKGFNINIPLNKTGFGNTEYASAFHQLLLPIAYEYNPELIIVSSGYDAAIGCFEGKMRITPACYAHLLNQLSCLSNGKLCVLLEGGYCIKSLSEGVALSVRSLLGYPTPRIEPLGKPDPVYVQTLMNLIACLIPHWKCLQGLNDNDSVSLKDYLEKWDIDYRKDKNIPFYSYENRPETFELDCYTHLSFDVEEKNKLEKAINDLIENTDLSFPKHKTCLSVADSVKASLDKTILDKVVSVSGQNELVAVLDSIGSKNSTNGLVMLKSTGNHGVLDNLTYAKQKFTQFKKVLVVELTESHLSNNDETFLFVSLNSKAEAKNRINLNLSEIDDAALISYFLKIVMPIAYQFNPDLVLLSSDFSTASGRAISLLALTNVIKMLSGLANGNLLLIFEENDSFNSIAQTINKSLSILIGDSCQALPTLVASEIAKKAIKEKTEILKASWDCFQFGDKLPHA